MTDREVELALVDAYLAGYGQAIAEARQLLAGARVASRRGVWERALAVLGVRFG